MNAPFAFTPEQFSELLRTLKGDASASPTGVGAPGRLDVGLACAGGPCKTGEVEWLMARSPVCAFARAARIPFNPFPYMVTTTFANAGANQTNPDQGPNRATERDVIFHSVDVDVQDPNEFVGNVLKAERDYYFAITSGVQCTMKIDGVDRWSTPYFPVRSLSKLIFPDKEPWVLKSKQSIQMDFTVTTPLPAAGIVFNIVFLGITPSSGDVVRMSNTDAFAGLDKLGYDTAACRAKYGC